MSFVSSSLLSLALKEYQRVTHLTHWSNYYGSFCDENEPEYLSSAMTYKHKHINMHALWAPISLSLQCSVRVNTSTSMLWIKQEIVSTFTFILNNSKIKILRVIVLIYWHFILQSLRISLSYIKGRIIKPETHLLTSEPVVCTQFNSEVQKNLLCWSPTSIITKELYKSNNYLIIWCYCTSSHV